ncbi:MAG: hypothetical protein AAB959_01250 [Patescibacteria group bacterium]|mgnify:FL=1
MQQILIIIILISFGAFYLVGQAQPDSANFFEASIAQIRQKVQVKPSLAQSSKTTAKKPITKTKQNVPARNASHSDAGGQKKPAVSVAKPEVKISSIRIQTLSSPSLITLYTNNLQKDEKINITGWEIKTKNGSFLISKGLEKEDIIIKQGDRIYISSDPSPFLEKDKNFRPNKCMGYLSSSHKFTIPLPQTCPRPQSDKLPAYLNYWCKEYINTLGSCQAPTYDGLAKYELFKDDNCMSYLNTNLNYNGCFLNYQKDQNFYSREWHIYLDRRDKEIFPWNNEFDTLYIKDKNGLIVDKYDFGQRVCCD